MSLLANYQAYMLAIPAYYILAVLPHSYSIYLVNSSPAAKKLNTATSGADRLWDNRNPRSTTLKSSLQSKLDPHTFALYERAEACHANSMENLPVFATAVLLGHVAGVPRQVLDTFAWRFLALRTVYTAIYLGVQGVGHGKKASFGRSAVWVASVVLCVRVMVQAARAAKEIV